MEPLPPLPSFEDKMEVSETIQIEVESDSIKLVFEFLVTMDVTFDPLADEIVIECREEKIDTII
jgi:hypothetical protein